MSFSFERISDPGYFSENRTQPHCDYKYFRSTAEAETGESSYIQSLNGLWKFCYATNYECAPKGFEQPGFDCKCWSDINVPGHIQLQGYDVPHYVNVQYPWEGHEEIEPGEIPADFNPVASYAKHFYLPSHMQGERLYISFQGVESGFALWLNGSYVGYATDSFTPSEFELTPYLIDGENKLAVQVFKFTAGSWLEDQDFFRFSGIFRDVYLYSVPKIHMRDLKIITELSDDYKSADLKMTALFDGSDEGIVKTRLLYDGAEVCKSETQIKHEVLMQLHVDAPHLWSAEKPHLYQLEMTVTDNAGSVTEIVLVDTGLRRFELVGKVMHLNGKRIEFYGTNRHEFSCYGGRTLTKDEMLFDILTMKRNNINAVRTSHYPNHPYFYELCNKYGLYVIDEVNMESHGRWHMVFESGGMDTDAAIPGDNPKWRDTAIDRVLSLYHRDKNHPCVLIWSLGNESYGGRYVLEMAECFRSLDKSRLVHYEGITWDQRYPDTTDIYSQMYTPAVKAGQFLQENKEKPMILCEYAHAMGNSCGAVDKYIRLMEREERFQGAFIWDFIDQALCSKDRYGKDYLAVGGDFGDRPADYNFCANGIINADRTLSPKVQAFKYLYQGIGIKIDDKEITIKNKYLFTSTDEFNCVVILQRDGEKILQTSLETDVAPLATKKYALPVSLPLTSAGEYTLTVSFRLRSDSLWAKRGHEIAFEQYTFKRGSACISMNKAPFKAVRGCQAYGVKGEHFSAIFSTLRGGLMSYKYGGREMIEQIPMPNFWRAPTDNDVGNRMAARHAQWKIASLYALPQHFAAELFGQKPLVPAMDVFDDKAVITYNFILPLNPPGLCKVVYTVTGEGTVDVTVECDPRPHSPMPEFGMMFKLSADYDNLKWYGMGPDECYVDRAYGAKLGIYSTRIGDNMTRYIVPQECGNRVGVRWAEITDNRGRGIVFTAGDEYGAMELSALPYTPHEIENAVHSYELPQRHYTVVRVNRQQMGIAGDDGWGARTHDEYLLPADKQLSFTFSFKGI